MLLLILSMMLGCWQKATALNRAKNSNALQLADTDPRHIKQKFSVVLERTVRELRGQRCLDVENNVTAKQIVVSRSFVHALVILKL